MNYSVHAIMYFYFATSQYTRALSFLRKPIMSFQLGQMAVGMLIVGATFYYSRSPLGCTSAYTNEYFVYCGIMYASYFVLFGKMYLDTFVFKTRKTNSDVKPKSDAKA